MAMYRIERKGPWLRPINGGFALSIKIRIVDPHKHVYRPQPGPGIAIVAWLLEPKSGSNPSPAEPSPLAPASGMPYGPHWTNTDAKAGSLTLVYRLDARQDLANMRLMIRADLVADPQHPRSDHSQDTTAPASVGSSSRTVKSSEDLRLETGCLSTRSFLERIPANERRGLVVLDHGLLDLRSTRLAIEMALILSEPAARRASAQVAARVAAQVAVRGHTKRHEKHRLGRLGGPHHTEHTILMTGADEFQLPINPASGRQEPVETVRWVDEFIVERYRRQVPLQPVRLMYQHLHHFGNVLVRPRQYFCVGDRVPEGNKQSCAIRLSHIERLHRHFVLHSSESTPPKVFLSHGPALRHLADESDNKQETLLDLLLQDWNVIDQGDHGTDTGAWLLEKKAKLPKFAEFVVELPLPTSSAECNHAGLPGCRRLPRSHLQFQRHRLGQILNKDIPAPSHSGKDDTERRAHVVQKMTEEESEGASQLAGSSPRTPLPASAKSKRPPEDEDGAGSQKRQRSV